MFKGHETKQDNRVVRLCCCAAAVAIVLLAFVAFVGAAPARNSYDVLLEFPAASTQAEYLINLGRDIIIRIWLSTDAHRVHMGWGFAAIDRRIADSPNFFYDCLCGHGPRPHDLYAWHVVENYYPSERNLPVYGYPIEVRVRCRHCEVAGADARQAHFVGGTVEVSWRRLPQNNPRQLRIGDVLRRNR